jgi:hypothetical protein
LLRKSAKRFNQANDAVCSEWSLEIISSGICCPRDRQEFTRLVKIKLIALTYEDKASVHTITGY